MGRLKIEIRIWERDTFCTVDQSCDHWPTSLTFECRYVLRLYGDPEIIIMTWHVSRGAKTVWPEIFSKLNFFRIVHHIHTIVAIWLKRSCSHDINKRANWQTIKHDPCCHTIVLWPLHCRNECSLKNSKYKVTAPTQHDPSHQVSGCSPRSSGVNNLPKIREESKWLEPEKK